MPQKPTQTAEGAKQTAAIKAAQEAGKATAPAAPSTLAKTQRDTTDLAQLAAQSRPLPSRSIQSAKPLSLPRGSRGRSFSRE